MVADATGMTGRGWNARRGERIIPGDVKMADIFTAFVGPASSHWHRHHEPNRQIDRRPPFPTHCRYPSQPVSQLLICGFQLSKASPHLGLLACGAEYAPAFPKAYKKMLASPKKWDRLAASWAGESAAQRALLSTTQAIDVSEGPVCSDRFLSVFADH